MNKRKKLTEIQAAFDRGSDRIETAESTEVEEEVKADLKSRGASNEDKLQASKTNLLQAPLDFDGSLVKDGSLSAALKVPKKSAKKIRFTLDLEKPLDDRLNKASSKLNRSKAELVRFAVKRLLEELESEWKN